MSSIITHPIYPTKHAAFCVGDHNLSPADGSEPDPCGSRAVVAEGSDLFAVVMAEGGRPVVDVEAAHSQRFTPAAFERFCREGLRLVAELAAIPAPRDGLEALTERLDARRSARPGREEGSTNIVVVLLVLAAVAALGAGRLLLTGHLTGGILLGLQCPALAVLIVATNGLDYLTAGRGTRSASRPTLAITAAGENPAAELQEAGNAETGIVVTVALVVGPLVWLAGRITTAPSATVVGLAVGAVLGLFLAVMAWVVLDPRGVRDSGQQLAEGDDLTAVAAVVFPAVNR